MLGSWFSSKSSDNLNKEVDPLRPSVDALHAEDTPHPDSVPPPHRTSSTGFSSPHDDVLAELYGLCPNAAQSNLGAAPTAPTDDVKGKSNATAVPRSKQLRQELRDPFSGALIGAFVPFEQGDDDAGIDAKGEELWSHLSKILELQSELAQMHLEMESVGAKEGEGRLKGTKGTSRNWGERDGEGRDEDEDEEAEANKAREEEFAALASKFNGRRAAIDGIMNKLGELSDSVSAFHTIQTPHLNFPPCDSTDTNTEGKNTDDRPTQQSTVTGTKSTSNEPQPPTLDGNVSTDTKTSTYPNQDPEPPENRAPTVPVILVQDSSRLVDSPTQVFAIPQPVEE